MARGKMMAKQLVMSWLKDLEEAAWVVGEIGKECRTIQAIRLNLNAEANKLEAKAMTNVKPHKERIIELVERLRTFAEANRKQLTKNGKHKTVVVLTGVFGWRNIRSAVLLHNPKLILALLKSRGLERFIRTKETIDKEALGREPDVAKMIEGISISTEGEVFFVKPVGGEEITASTISLKRAE